MPLSLRSIEHALEHPAIDFTIAAILGAALPLGLLWLLMNARLTAFITLRPLVITVLGVFTLLVYSPTRRQWPVFAISTLSSFFAALLITIYLFSK